MSQEQQINDIKTQVKAISTLALDEKDEVDNLVNSLETWLKDLNTESALITKVIQDIADLQVQILSLL